MSRTSTPASAAPRTNASCIVGDDSRKGFIFLEWSKDETPRYFRYAIRPLFHIWNPDNVPWDKIPFEKRPMVQVARAPFAREQWTHVVFTLENINDKRKPPVGKLYLNGKLQGAIEKWNLTFEWDPAKVLLVLGASAIDRGRSVLLRHLFSSGGVPMVSPQKTFPVSWIR